jgi:hypothetical protein
MVAGDGRESVNRKSAIKNLKLIGGYFETTGARWLSYHRRPADVGQQVDNAGRARIGFGTQAYDGATE